MSQPPYPLHESVVDRIAPDYADFYNKHIIDKQQVHLQSIEANRSSGILIPGAGPIPSEGLASTVDYSIPRAESEGPDVKVRCFTPKGDKPAAGWPVCIYYHGGGWVLGTIDTENVVASHLCVSGKCVVVSVDYR
jgi:acetyl esterase/lipase